MITIDKVHWLVKFGLNKLDSSLFTDVLPNEIDEQLNKSQLSVIREMVAIKGVEFNRVITTDLAPIVIRSEQANPIYLTNSTEIRLYSPYLKNDCLQFIRGEVDATKNGCKKTIPIIDREYDDNTYLKSSKQQKTSFIWNRVIGYFGKTTEGGKDGTSLFLDNDDFIIDLAYISYIKYPRKISLGGYLDIDGSTTVTSEFEFNTQMIYKIIDHAIFEIASNLQYPDAKSKFEISQLTNLN